MEVSEQYHTRWDSRVAQTIATCQFYSREHMGDVWQFFRLPWFTYSRLICVFYNYEVFGTFGIFDGCYLMIQARLLEIGSVS